MKKILLAKQLKQLIGSVGKSVYQVADETGIHFTNLYDYLGERRFPGKDNLDKLEAYFGTKFELGMNEEKSKDVKALIADMKETLHRLECLLDDDHLTLF